MCLISIEIKVQNTATSFKTNEHVHFLFSGCAQLLYHKQEFLFSKLRESYINSLDFRWNSQCYTSMHTHTHTCMRTHTRTCV